MISLADNRSFYAFFDTAHASFLGGSKYDADFYWTLPEPITLDTTPGFRWEATLLESFIPVELISNSESLYRGINQFGFEVVDINNDQNRKSYSLQRGPDRTPDKYVFNDWKEWIHSVRDREDFIGRLIIGILFLYFYHCFLDIWGVNAFAITKTNSATSKPKLKINNPNIQIVFSDMLASQLGFLGGSIYKPLPGLNTFEAVHVPDTGKFYYFFFIIFLKKD